MINVLNVMKIRILSWMHRIWIVFAKKVINYLLMA